MRKALHPLPLQQFKQLVQHGILFSIDLIIYNKQGLVLMGLRKNNPAKDFWFLPGGRVYKNESLAAALMRISQEETGLGLTPKDVVMRPGIWQHIHLGENAFDEPGFGTHYVAVALQATKQYTLDDVWTDEQHLYFQFMSTDALLKDERVHPLAKKYFQPQPDNRFPF